MTAGHWWGGYCYDRPAFPILWFLLRLHSNPDKKSIDFCSRLTGKCRTRWLELVRKTLEHVELMERGGNQLIKFLKFIISNLRLTAVVVIVHDDGHFTLLGHFENAIRLNSWANRIPRHLKF
jgi:hypothetical protein